MSGKESRGGTDHGQRELDHRGVSRREFLKMAGVAGAGLTFGGGLGGILAACGEETTTTTAGATTTTAAATTSETSGGSDTTTSSVSASGEVETVKLGALYPYTGPVGFLGTMAGGGIKQAAEEINAAGGVQTGGKTYRFEVIEYDTRLDPATEIAGATKLVADGCKIIWDYGAFVGAQRITEPAKVLLVCCGISPAGTTENAGIKYTLAHEAGSATASLSAKWYADTLNVKKIAAFTENQVMQMEIREATIPTLEARGVEVVFDEVFNSEITDFSTALTKIKAAGPDILLQASMGDNAGKIFQQRLDINYPVQIVGVSLLAVNGAAKAKVLGTAANGLIEEIGMYPIDLTPSEQIAESAGIDLGKRAAFIANSLKNQAAEYTTATKAVFYDEVYYFSDMVGLAGGIDSDALVKAFEQETFVKGSSIGLKWFKENHRFVLPRVFGRILNINAQSGAFEIEDLATANPVDALGSDWDIKVVKKVDAQDIRAGKDPNSANFGKPY